MTEAEKKANRNISLRPVVDGDREFLLKVYEASRAIELAMVAWDPAQIRAFVEHQFDAQTRFYESEYPETRHDIIFYGDKPAGRLFVSRGEKIQIAILDITVLPEYRKNGIATQLISELKNEAAGSNRSLRVFVEGFNPSQELFRKLGFESVETDTINLRFEWRKSDG